MLNIKIDQLQKYIESLIKKELDSTQTFDTFFTGKILSISNGNYRIQLDNLSQDLINAYPLNDKMFSKDDYVYVVKIVNALNSNYAILDKVRDLQEEFINLPLAERFKEKETIKLSNGELSGGRLVGNGNEDADFIKIIKNNGTFKVKAKFTKRDQEEKIQGGLKISLGNKLTTKTNEEGESIEVYDPEGTLAAYFLVEDDLIGQPERMFELPQEKVFLIEDKNICELFQYIYFEKTGIENSFSCTDIDLISGSLLDVDAVIQIKIKFENDKDYFAKDDIPAHDNSVKVIADVYYDGQLLDLEGQIQYYWLIKDESVTDDYLSLAGKGWKCLNEFEEVNFIGDFENSSFTSKLLKNWKNEDKFIILNTEDVENFLEYENILKCLVRFGDNIISSKEFIVYNYKQEQFFAEIIYPTSPVILFDQENLSLTCSITNGSSRIQLSNYNISYSWSRSADGENWQPIKIDEEKILDTKTIFIYDREELGEIPENTKSYQYIQMTPDLELEYFKCEAIIRTLNGDYVSTEYGIQEIISKVDLETEINIRVQYKYFISEYTDLNFQKSKSGGDWNIYLPDGTQGEWVEGEEISEDTVFSDMSIFNGQAELEKGLYVYFTKRAFWYETKEGEDNILREDVWDFPLIARQVGYVEGELVNIKEGYSIEQLNTFNKLTNGGENQGIYYEDIGAPVSKGEAPNASNKYYVREVNGNSIEYIPIQLDIIWGFQDNITYYEKINEDNYFEVDKIQGVNSSKEYYLQEKDAEGKIKYKKLPFSTAYFKAIKTEWPEGETGPFYENVKERLFINADYIQTGTLRVGDVDNEIFYASLHGNEENPVKIAGYYVSNTDLASSDGIVGISSDIDKNAFWAGPKVEITEGDETVEKNKFQVTHNGDLFAQNVDITGNLRTANYGSIIIYDNNNNDNNSNFSTGLEYELNADGNSYTLTSMGSCKDTEVRIPPVYNNKPVTVIGYLAFNMYGTAAASVTNIKIPNSITTIKSQAFYGCLSIEELELPDSIINLDGNTFLPGGWDTPKLKRLIIGDKISVIPKNAFIDAHTLEEVIIGRGVKEIEQYAFRGCSALKRVFYRGTEAEWENIYIVGRGSNDNPLTSATIYYYVSDDNNLYSGNYWQYSGFKISSIDPYMIESHNFKVTSTGEIMATNAYLSGQVVASSGSIGNCTINPDGSIISANGNFTVDVNGNLQASGGTIGNCTINTDGSIVSANGNFNVDANGNLQASGGTIGNCTINTDGSIVSANGNFNVDANGSIKLIGTNDYAYLIDSDNFKVTQRGELEASSGHISGFDIQPHGIFGNNLSLSSNYLGFGNIDNNQNMVTFSCVGNTVVLNTKGPFYIESANGAEKTFLLFGQPTSTTQKTNAYLSLTITKTTSGLLVKDYISCRYRIAENSSPVSKAITQTIEYQIRDAVISDSNISWYPSKFFTFTISPNATESNEFLEDSFSEGLLGSFIRFRYLGDSDWLTTGEDGGENGYRANYYTDYQIGAARSHSFPVLEQNIQVQGNLVPRQDYEYFLGDKEKRWLIHGEFVNSQSVASLTDSDETIKNNIFPLSEKYQIIFDNLIPVSYKLNSGTSNRTHTGLSAQGVKKAIELSGLTTIDFAGYCEWENSEGIIQCGLRYDEFIALCIDQIQKLKKRVEELENKNKES